MTPPVIRSPREASDIPCRLDCHDTEALHGNLEEHKLRALDSRHEMTGADRQWAAQYEEGDLVRYTRGSKVLGIDPGEYARVDRVDARENHTTIVREYGAEQTYDPRRLSGVAV